MALFQKKPQVTSSIPLYSVGFEVVEFFAQKNSFPNWINNKDLKALVSVTNIGESRVILSRPTTFMNDSGQAAQALQHFYRVYNQNTLVVYDELAIPFGQLRTRLGGSDAGHNGIKSLISHISSDFGRLRIGIGSELAQKADAADFVLGKFNKEEQSSLPLILREANDLINAFVLGDGLKAETRSVN
jgi:PTH1 family peptidyl-tRNA hydrolase